MPPNEREQQALEAVIARATKDRAFRKKLLTDPRRAIQDAYAVTIPANFRIQFIEKTSGVDALIVLPDFQAADGELTDSDLEAVSGGVDPTDVGWSAAILASEGDASGLTDVTDLGDFTDLSDFAF